MISMLMTEEEAIVLTKFLLEHDIDPNCSRSHPLCFLLARLFAEPDLRYGIPKDVAQTHPDKEGEA